MLRFRVALGVADPPTEATPLPTSDFVQAAAMADKSDSVQAARTRDLIRHLPLVRSIQWSSRPATSPLQRL
jgi:hypothetical protein